MAGWCIYIRQRMWSPLVQIMACCLFHVNPLSEPMLTYSQFDHKERISMKFYLKFWCLHQNAFENVCCKMAAILSQPQYVFSTPLTSLCFLLFTAVVVQFMWTTILTMDIMYLFKCFLWWFIQTKDINIYFYVLEHRNAHFCQFIKMVNQWVSAWKT